MKRIGKLLGITIIGLYIVLSGFLAIAGYLEPKPPAQMNVHVATAYITNPQCTNDEIFRQELTLAKTLE